MMPIMRALAALLLTTALAPAVYAKSGAARTVSPKNFWTKRYTPRRYAANWYIDLQVADFDRVRKQVLGILKRFKGRPTIPVDNIVGGDKVKYQQFSFELHRDSVQRVVARLRRLGRVRRDKQMENLVPDVDEEIDRKLSSLLAERGAGKVPLERFPAIRATINEMIEHLQIIKASKKASKDRVLLNIVLEAAK